MSKDKLQNDFEKACNDIKSMTSLDNDTLLNLYGLYKQATLGDCNTSKPSFFDPKGQAKWTAWNDNNGQPKKQVDPRDDPHDDCMHWLGSL
jgi:diazepam-binding inhibitor (GABA receptor modulating acyl-CoA-binding protein)